MDRERLADLRIFLAVVEERGFTQAAARLRTSQSAVSNAVRRLEEHLDIRLLNRTTRRVAPTQAGERLAAGVAPCLEQIDDQVDALSAFRDRPAGLIRIATSARAAEKILWPKLSPLLREYPEIEVELVVEQKFTDIITERFDAGVRLGESIDQDMIAVQIGPEMRMALVGAPEYFRYKGTPGHPRDLLNHSCINLRLETRGNLYAWEFEEDGRPLNVRVEGQLTFNRPGLCRNAAVDGHGLAYLPEDQVDEDLDAGRLLRALEGWCPSFPGYHLYYPSRRQSSPALNVLIERLRRPS